MRKIGIGLAIALGIGVLVISLQPAEQRVEREAKIDAPLDFVMAQLQDFRRWPAWSPWENLDPNLDREYAGAPAGVGATYHWTGNEDVGEGRMRIVRIEPLRELAIELNFIKPSAARHEMTFTLEPAGAATVVRWAMSGRRDLAGRFAALFVDGDAALGTDFEAGLAALAKVCEAEAADWRRDLLVGAETAAEKEAAAAEAAVLRIGPEKP